VGTSHKDRANHRQAGTLKYTVERFKKIRTLTLLRLGGSPTPNVAGAVRNETATWDHMSLP
jgi:hypothetical protein